MPEVILTDHVKSRFIERNVDIHEAKQAAKNGVIIKTENGIIKRRRELGEGRVIRVVCKQEGSKIIIITAYYEN